MKQENGRKTQITLSIVSIAAASLMTAGCGSIDEYDEDDGDEPGATMRFVHSVADAPAVDVYVVGAESPAIAGLELGSTSATLSVSTGTYQFEIRASGAAADSVPLLTTDPLSFEEGSSITAVAAGLLDGSGNNDQLRVLVFEDSFDTPRGDSATVRLIHAAPDAPTVALDLGDDGTIEYENIERFATSSNGGVQIRAETEHQLAIYAGHPLARVTAFTLPPLARGSQLFMIATGKLASEGRAVEGFSILSIPPAGSDAETIRIRQNPIVYVVHAGADAPAIDVDADGATIIADLSFGELATPLQLPPGDYDLAIFPAGLAGQPVASTHTPELVAGYEFLAVATGLLAPVAGEAPFEVVYFVDDFELGDVHSARLRPIHGSPDAPPVDISPLALDGALVTPLLEAAIPFGSASVAEGLSVPASALRVGVAASGQSLPVASFDISAAPGARIFTIAAGALTPHAARAPFQLLNIDTAAPTWSIASLAPVVTH